MRPWNVAIDNKVAVYLLILMIFLIGLMSYSTMPREAAPDISIPWVIVTIPYPGVSPSDIEGLVTQPLEQDLQSVSDVKQITSSSKEGIATIRVEFNTDVDIDDALRRVRDKVNSARPSLPTDILEPIVSEINFSEFPIMIVNVGGQVGLARLKGIAEELQDDIEAIPGILRADLSGGLQPEVQVNCDVYRLKAYQIGFDDVVSAIRGENLSIPGGTIDNGSRAFSVRVPGEFKQVQPIEDIVIKIQNGRPIYVRDVATIDYSFEDRLTYARLNQTDVVSLQVRKRAGENLLRIADEVRTIVDRTQQTLPAGIEIDVSNDQSVNIRNSVHELENSIMTGMFLVIVSLFMFFGLKNASLISMAIPLSMFIGFIILSAMDVTLNFVVLFALVLVLGIIVDDAIVVVENIYRHQRDYGKSPVQAARDATSEVAVPVLTSTLSTVSPFIPLLFWEGVFGDFMWYLPVTLIATLGASLFIANVISPVQGAVWIDYQKEISTVKASLERPSGWRVYNPFSWVLWVLRRIYHRTDESMFPWMQERYASTLQWALRHKWKTILGTFGLLFFSFVLYGFLGRGVILFGNVDPAMVNVRIESPPGTALEVTNEISEEVEERVAKVQGIKDVEFLSTSVGTSDDPFDFNGQGTSNKAGLAVNFYKKDLRGQSSSLTVEEIREATTGIPGAVIRVVKQEMGPPSGAAVSIEVSGDDYETLARLSAEMRARIKDVAGLVDLKDDYNKGKPEVEVIVDREKAGLFWTSTGQIASTVRSAINGAEASKFRVGEDEYKIRVRLAEQQRSSVEDLENIHISFMNRRGQMLSIPLVSVADVVRSQGVSEIRRKDLKRVVTITGNVEGRVQSEVLQEVQTRLSDFSMPAGYSFRFTGQNEEMEKASIFLFRAFLITLLLVFLTLVAEFNSLKVPLVIMVTVPFALVGVLLGLIVTQTPFSVIMTGVGTIALVGIVVKNAIVLLDFVKHKRDEGGLTLDEALVEAGKTRLRPVMLTATTTVLGVLPLATGFDFDWRGFHFVVGAESAGFWGPLGIAIISGLSFSSFLTLVIVPVIYSKLEEVTDWLAAVLGRTRASVSRLAGNGRSQS